MVRVFCLAVLMGWTFPLGAHPSHSTLAELEVDGNQLQMALQLRMADIDVALTHRKLVGSDEEVYRELVTPHIQLKGPGGKPVPFTWVGMEDEGFQVWVYLEWRLDHPPSAYSLRNTLFYDVESRTVHVMNIREGKKRGSLTFHQGQEWREFPVLVEPEPIRKPVENSPPAPDRVKTKAP